MSRDSRLKKVLSTIDFNDPEKIKVGGAVGTFDLRVGEFMFHYYTRKDWTTPQGMSVLKYVFTIRRIENDSFLFSEYNVDVDLTSNYFRSGGDFAGKRAFQMASQHYWGDALDFFNEVSAKVYKTKHELDDDAKNALRDLLNYSLIH